LQIKFIIFSCLFGDAPPMNIYSGEVGCGPYDVKNSGWAR